MCSKCQQQKYNWVRLEWKLAAIFESTYSPVSAASISSPYYGHCLLEDIGPLWPSRRDLSNYSFFFSSNTFPFTFKGSTRLHRAFYSAPRLTFAQLKIINLISTVSFSSVRSFSVYPGILHTRGSSTQFFKKCVAYIHSFITFILSKCSMYRTEPGNTLAWIRLTTIEQISSKFYKVLKISVLT